MKNMPKGKTPSLIGASNGRPKRVPVLRQSKCSRCGGPIAMGDDCFGIPKSGVGFRNERRYCQLCFNNILEQTQKDLDELKTL